MMSQNFDVYKEMSRNKVLWNIILERRTERSHLIEDFIHFWAITTPVIFFAVSIQY